MVLLKIAAILAFVIVGAHFIHPKNYHPFVPEGWSGVLTGGSIIFFTYIGFDSVSTAAEEAKNPQRDLPIGIIATLVVCTVLYIAVAVVLTGIVNWSTLVDDAAPVVNSMKRLTLLTGVEHAALDPAGRALRRLDGHDLVAVGVSARASARLVRHVARRPAAQAVRLCASQVPHPFDGDLDCRLSGGHTRRHPDIGTLADLSNIGTLFAFVLVSIGVIILRYKQPESRRGFRAPGGLTAPVLSVLFCILLMAGLPILTWLRFFAWLIIGLRCTRSTAAITASSAPEERKR